MVDSPLRWAAEWEPQSAVMFTWPHEDGDWADGLEAVHACFVEIAAAIAETQPILICAKNSDWAAKISLALGGRMDRTHRVRIHVLESNDVWVRDYGPLSVL